MSLLPEEVSFIGDDVPDVACIRWAGLGIAVANARKEVLAAADWVTPSRGGWGAGSINFDVVIATPDTMRVVGQTIVKITTPSFKQVYRLYDQEKMAIADLVTLRNEIVNTDKYILFDPLEPWKEKEIKPTARGGPGPEPPRR